MMLSFLTSIVHFQIWSSDLIRSMIIHISMFCAWYSMQKMTTWSLMLSCLYAHDGVSCVEVIKCGSHKTVFPKKAWIILFSSYFEKVHKATELRAEHAALWLVTPPWSVSNIDRWVFLFVCFLPFHCSRTLFSFVPLKMRAYATCYLSCNIF